MKRVLLPVLGLLVAALASGGAAWADTALHGQCNGTGTGTCVDNGTNTPLGNSSTFGFSIGGGPDTGTQLIDILIPNNYTEPTSFTIDFAAGGVAGTASQLPGTWSSKDLADFLMITATPNNPIGNYLPIAQFLNPGATVTGFFVFQANLGSQTIPGNDSSGQTMAAGLFDIPAGFSSDLGAYIVSFCGGNCPSTYDATANSGALVNNGNTPVPTPEPGSLLMLGAGLVGVAMLAGRRTLTA